MDKFLNILINMKISKEKFINQLIKTLKIYNKLFIKQNRKNSFLIQNYLYTFFLYN